MTEQEMHVEDFYNEEAGFHARLNTAEDKDTSFTLSRKIVEGEHMQMSSDPRLRSLPLSVESYRIALKRSTSASERNLLCSISETVRRR